MNECKVKTKKKTVTNRGMKKSTPIRECFQFILLKSASLHTHKQRNMLSFDLI